MTDETPPLQQPARSPSLFHVTDILSVMTEKLVSQNGLDGFYAFLNYLFSEDLQTAQTAAALDVAGPYLRGLFPDLAHVDVSGITGANHRVWLSEVTERYGEWFEVPALPAGAADALPGPVSVMAAGLGRAQR